MRITLIGSTKFERAFKEIDKKLALCGHTVYTVARYPSDEKEREWYTKDEKEVLDLVHLKKIVDSDAVLVVDHPGPDGKPYIGESTKRELRWASITGKKIFRVSENPSFLVCNPLEMSRIEFSQGFPESSNEFDFGLNLIKRI